MNPSYGFLLRMPVAKPSFEHYALALLNELRWLLVPIVSFCVCFTLTILFGSIYQGMSFKIGDPITSFIYNTFTFSLSFISGAIFAPRWRIFSILPQYFILGYFGWEFYSEYTFQPIWNT